MRAFITLLGREFRATLAHPGTPLAVGVAWGVLLFALHWNGPTLADPSLAAEFTPLARWLGQLGLGPGLIGPPALVLAAGVLAIFAGTAGVVRARESGALEVARMLPVSRFTLVGAMVAGRALFVWGAISIALIPLAALFALPASGAPFGRLLALEGVLAVVVLEFVSGTLLLSLLVSRRLGAALLAAGGIAVWALASGMFPYTGDAVFDAGVYRLQQGLSPTWALRLVLLGALALPAIVGALAQVVVHVLVGAVLTDAVEVVPAVPGRRARWRWHWRRIAWRCGWAIPAVAMLPVVTLALLPAAVDLSAGGVLAPSASMPATPDSVEPPDLEMRVSPVGFDAPLVELALGRLAERLNVSPPRVVNPSRSWRGVVVATSYDDLTGISLGGLTEHAMTAVRTRAAARHAWTVGEESAGAIGDPVVVAGPRRLVALDTLLLAALTSYAPAPAVGPAVASGRRRVILLGRDARRAWETLLVEEGVEVSFVWPADAAPARDLVWLAPESGSGLSPAIVARVRRFREAGGTVGLALPRETAGPLGGSLAPLLGDLGVRAPACWWAPPESAVSPGAAPEVSADFSRGVAPAVGVPVLARIVPPAVSPESAPASLALLAPAPFALALDDAWQAVVTPEDASARVLRPPLGRRLLPGARAPHGGAAALGTALPPLVGWRDASRSEGRAAVLGIAPFFATADEASKNAARDLAANTIRWLMGREPAALTRKPLPIAWASEFAPLGRAPGVPLAASGRFGAVLEIARFGAYSLPVLGLALVWWRRRRRLAIFGDPARRFR